MKKFFVLTLMTFAFLLAQLALPPEVVAVDNDIGYSLTIDQNATVIPVFTIQSPVISGEVNYLLDREVSVPLKYPSQETITNNNIEQFLMCRIDNYSQSWQRSISTNLELPSNRINQYNQGVFRLDIGENYL